MKRLIVTAALAALAVPAFAAEVGKPFEQTELDRALPQVNIPAPAQRDVDTASLPYEQAQVDRMLPTLDNSGAQSATLGNASATAKSPWANDWNFIAPAA